MKYTTNSKNIVLIKNEVFWCHQVDMKSSCLTRSEPAILAPKSKGEQKGAPRSAPHRSSEEIIINSSPVFLPWKWSLSFTEVLQ